MALTEPRLLHLIYIHGFQGDDTSFQKFPTDLQEYLAAHISPQFNIHIQSSLYPTYKSTKPLSFATKNFLQWLQTQPPGPVIVLGHSLGGFLASEAATDPSSTDRIVGMVAFDTPYLGMHPHVVVSGIASLFEKQNDPNAPTERDLNAEHPDVQIVNDTDEWAHFKKDIDARRSISPPPLPPRPPSHSAPSSPNPYGLPATPLIDKAISLIEKYSNDPLIRWVRKHSDEPIAASKRWIVEHFQFGSAVFEPTGLKDRYSQLVTWHGDWINYWSETSPAGIDPTTPESRRLDDIDNDLALLESGVVPDTTSLHPSNSSISVALSTDSQQTVNSSLKLGASEKGNQNEDKERLKRAKHLQKERKKTEKMIWKTHHFVVLPNGLARALGGLDKWEKVRVSAADDEVAAHCGLFMRKTNTDYNLFVERVGMRILGWCERI